jgi:small subunit ribosomal protein S9
VGAAAGQEGDAPGAQAAAVDDEAAGVDGEDVAPRVRPEIPGADLEPDIVLEGSDPLSGRAKPEIPGADLEPDIVAEDEEELVDLEPEEPDAGGRPSEDEEPRAITQAAIDLAAGARYRATGKRKTSIARVILRPGTGAYTINGRPLDDHFPRPTLQRTIRQPLETVGYHARMDVVATIQGGGVSGQAGALRHGIARALIEADPNLRAELKRRGFLTRDARVKERKKAGLKKARKRPQFSKR